MLGIANYQRVDRLMSEAGVDVMIVSTPVSVSYLTSYELGVDRIFKKHMVDPGAPDQRLPLFAVYAAETEPTLVIPAAWAPNAASSYGK